MKRLAESPERNGMSGLHSIESLIRIAIEIGKRNHKSIFGKLIPYKIPERTARKIFNFKSSPPLFSA